MKARTVGKLRVGGRDFAVMPWREYQRLTTHGKVGKVQRKRVSTEDAGDVAEIKRRSGEPSKSYADLRRKLGLA